MNIEEYIKYHIETEFKYSILNEKHGHINNIDKYVNILYDNIKTYIDTCTDYHKLYTNTISVKDNSSFFNICNLNLSIILDDKNSYNFDPILYGGYNIEKSGLTDNNEYLVTIDLMLEGNKDKILNNIKSLLAHEIAHAYTDYNKNSSILIKDKKITQNINVDKLYNGFESNNLYIRLLSNIIYFSLKDEIIAMQNEIYHDILSKRFGVRDINSANDILKTTNTYKRILKIDNDLNNLKNLDPILQDDIINYYNLIFNTNINNFNNIINKLDIAYKYARNKIITTASKYLNIAYAGRNMIR